MLPTRATPKPIHVPYIRSLLIRSSCHHWSRRLGQGRLKSRLKGRLEQGRLLEDQYRHLLEALGQRVVARSIDNTRTGISTSDCTGQVSTYARLAERSQELTATLRWYIDAIRAVESNAGSFVAISIP